ncbi:hypothetical protein HPB48_013433 [Haemaphysalis longicornis]|uniref:Fatty acid desaturase domain-containing protein n=1 Tax=Haemaphysalis longicornis TaxID=44386 RepID=A0A9J6FBQ3_HAELO|nr:hypothetical protein HPB48_013433 [Haemaphysalis longicornis]
MLVAKSGQATTNGQEGTAAVAEGTTQNTAQEGHPLRLTTRRQSSQTQKQEAMEATTVTSTSVTERKRQDGDDREQPPPSDDGDLGESKTVSQAPVKTEIVWTQRVLFVFLHAGAACGLYCALFTAKWQTSLRRRRPHSADKRAFGGEQANADKKYTQDDANRIVCLVIDDFARLIGMISCRNVMAKQTRGTFIGLGISGVGSSVAAHRLWCHRTFKAKLPLRILLMVANCFALQNDIYEWTRDHRLHHKYSDTTADPHNINRGFFFAHMGWLMCKKHPEVFRKGATIDCSDVLADPVVAFQRKYYVPLVTFFCFVLPTLVPMWLVGETFWNAHLVNGLLRYTVSLHMTWLVNSAAHTWGYRPYDKHIAPTENPAMAFGLFGEGFHNFHHAFPQDYKSSEFGPLLNPATIFIDLMAYIGQAYDLKTTPKHLIQKRIERTGDEKQHFLKAFVPT